MFSNNDNYDLDSAQSKIEASNEKNKTIDKMKHGHQLLKFNLN